MKFRKILITTLVLFIPMVAFFFAMSAMTRADSDNEPYSIFILAGQSWAEGTNSYKNKLPVGDGIDKQTYSPSDASTQFWWSGADGHGPTGSNYILTDFYDGTSYPGWLQSGGTSATGAARMETIANDTQRGGLFGPEMGISRELYDMGRRKVIILKVSYGLQSLAQSNSPFVPYDFNIHSVNKSYKRMKTEFESLTDYLKSIGKTYTVDGLFWLQGGTDALQDDYAAAYQQNFTDFVNAARTDFQLQPTAHIVAAKMSLMECLNNSFPTTIPEYCGFPYAQSVEPLLVADLTVGHSNFARRINQVRGALQTVADDNPRVDVVEMNDIPISNDFIHDNELGNIIFGRRFVHMYRLPYQPPPGSANLSDYDNDGIANSLEDTGTCSPPLNLTTQNATLCGSGWHDGNLGNDDRDNDGYPNYLDAINGPGSGLSQ